MCYKTSFTRKKNSLNKNIIEQKIFNQLYYNKFMVRGNILDKKIKIIDHYSDYSFENTTINDVGFSYNCFIHIFKHKLNPIIQFKLKTLDINSSSRYLPSLEKALTFVLFPENKFNSLYIIRPNKGGFFCYSTGFNGFMPFNSVVYSLKNFYFSKTIYFFKSSNFYVFKFFFNYIKILIIPHSFSLNFKKKKFRQNSFNIVFLLKSI